MPRPLAPRQKNLKTSQSPAMFDLCLRKPWAGKPRDYRDTTISEKFSFQEMFSPNENEKPASSHSSGFREAPFS